MVYRLDVITALQNRAGGLPLPAEVEAADIWRTIWHKEAHHSTAIERNTLVLRQVQGLLDKGRAVGNKELSEYLEVKGYADAADWVYRQAIRPEGLSVHGSDDRWRSSEQWVSEYTESRYRRTETPRHVNRTHEQEERWGERPEGAALPW